MSTFKELSRLICVNDIYEPFIAEFDASRNVGSIWEEWSIDLCGEKDLDPMEQIALVTSNQKPIGWVGYDMLLESPNTLRECMEPIDGDILISADTPLLEAIHTVCSGTESIYLVLKGNKFIGFLDYSLFHKLPFRMCLFALLIELEEIMLEIAKSDPRSFISNLSEGRLKKAEKIYKSRGYDVNKENKKYTSKLVECTTFVDKFTMLRKNKIVVEKCPGIENKFTKKAGELRNAIAHPKEKQLGLLPIEKEKLLPFIKWAEELQIQLYEFCECKFPNTTTNKKQIRGYCS